MASATFVVPHLSNADVPSCKGRELRETNPAFPRLFTLGDIFPNLYLVLLLVTCYLLFAHYLRAEYPATRADTPAYLSAAYHLGLIHLHKSITFHCVEPKTEKD